MPDDPTGPRRADIRRAGTPTGCPRRWYILAVPEEAFFGGARSVFSLAAPDERRECFVFGSGNADLAPSAVSPAGPQMETIWAEQAAENAGLRALVATFADKPRLRVAERYATGRRPGARSGGVRRC
jgi:hypothetical protein